MGGAERVLLDLLGMIRRAEPSWPLGLIVPSDGPLADEARRIGVRAIVVPFPSSLARLGDSQLSPQLTTTPAGWVRFLGRTLGASVSTLAYVRRLRREISAFGPDVVHSNGFKMHVLAALARSSDAALIWHVHDYVGSRPVACRVLRRLKRRCRLVVANSESVARDVRRQLGSGVDVRTVWNAIDTQRFKADGPRLDLDRVAGLPPIRSGVVRIGLVATFARWKGHIVFLEAMQALLTRRAIRAYVIGGPLYESEGSQYSIDELRAVASGLGLTASVGFTGFVEDPAAAFRSLDIVVHASTAPEPFGLVVAEAMATGRPVIVSDSGGVSEIVRSEIDALTYPTGNKAALLPQIERLLDDPGLRSRLGRAAREAAVERFSPVRMSRQILELYVPFDRASAAA
jgi:glycosyltransferase involved in cell wall biosynthesis